MPDTSGAINIVNRTHRNHRQTSQPYPDTGQ